MADTVIETRGLARRFADLLALDNLGLRGPARGRVPASLTVFIAALLLCFSFLSSRALAAQPKATTDWQTILRSAKEARSKLDTYAMDQAGTGFNFEGGKPVPLGRDEVHFRRSGELYDVVTTTYLLRDDGEYHKRDTYRFSWDGQKNWTSEEVVLPSGQTSVTGFMSASNTKELAALEGSGARLDGIAFGDKRPYYDILLESAETGEIVLQDGMEEIDGHPCHVIEAKCAYGYYKVWIDPNYGYNLRRLIVRKTENDLSWDEPLSQSVVMKQFEVEIKNSEIARIEDVYIPVEGHFEARGMSRRGGEQHWSSDMKRSNIELNPDFEAIGAFTIKFPEGTHVKDEDSGRVYIWDQGQLVPREKFRLRRKTGKEALELDVATWVSGEPTGLASLRGRTVVLAFWDCRDKACADLVRLLNGLYGKHSKSGVEIISVHSSDADADELKQFISERSIRYRVALDKPAGTHRGATFAKYEVRGVPTVYIIDREGKVRYQDIRLAATEAALKMLLSEK